MFVWIWSQVIVTIDPLRFAWIPVGCRDSVVCGKLAWATETVARSPVTSSVLEDAQQERPSFSSFSSNQVLA